jgi:hypothetical protein
MKRVLLLVLCLLWLGVWGGQPAVALSRAKDNPVVSVQSPAKDFITTESGLQYYDIAQGSGPSPQPGQTVVVNYVGKLQDGTIFDSSYKRNQPFVFTYGVGPGDPWLGGRAGHHAGGGQAVLAHSAGVGLWQPRRRRRDPPQCHLGF